MAAKAKRAPKPAGKTRAGYHHGDLRRALLETATDWIEEEGVDAVSLRGIAGRAGVSHAAPYRHFDDKEALIAAIAELGFDELRERIAGAAVKERDPVDRLIAAAVAYVEFARRRPGRYEVMFRGRRTYVDATAAASNQAFLGLVGLIEAAQSEGALPEDGTQDMARAAWALVHGLAELASTDRLSIASGAELQALTRRSARALIEGMARR